MGEIKIMRNKTNVYFHSYLIINNHIICLKFEIIIIILSINFLTYIT